MEPNVWSDRGSSGRYIRDSRFGISSHRSILRRPRVAPDGATASPNASRARTDSAAAFTGRPRRSLSAVHVAEREYSRMAVGRHFVSDEERRRAVATIFATLGAPRTMPRYYTDPFFFFIFFSSLFSRLLLARPRRPDEQIFALERRPRIDRDRGWLSRANVADQVAKYAVSPSRSSQHAATRECAWKITESPYANRGRRFVMERDRVSPILSCFSGETGRYRATDRFAELFSVSGRGSRYRPVFFFPPRADHLTRLGRRGCLSSCNPMTRLSARNATRFSFRSFSVDF